MNDQLWFSMNFPCITFPIWNSAPQQCTSYLLSGNTDYFVTVRVLLTDNIGYILGSFKTECHAISKGPLGGVVWQSSWWIQKVRPWFHIFATFGVSLTVYAVFRFHSLVERSRDLVLLLLNYLLLFLTVSLSSGPTSDLLLILCIILLLLIWPKQQFTLSFIKNQGWSFMTSFCSA